ncbi:MAG: AAA family ATPase [Elusimicrobiota bacterium]
MFSRKVVAKLIERLAEPRKFIQVLAGPRQTGKTTVARQTMEAIKIPSHYASADEPLLKDRSWLEQQWETARQLVKTSKKNGLLVLDEIQKIPHWSEVVKRLWDKDTFSGVSLHVVILGSSPLLVQKGLTESLAGRFETLYITHWSFEEMHAAFGWDVDKFVFFGGYPGTAPLINDQKRWADYIKNSLIEPTLSRDILLMTRVDKPALLRQLFELGTMYSGQVLSYQKMIGQLQDAGNTTTLAHYLELLSGAGLITGLMKYCGQIVRQRGSSPKLQVLNTALLTSQLNLNFEETKNEPDLWGRVVESAAGSSLANAIKGKDIGLFYWAETNCELDFVLSKGKRIVAIEVKSGRSKIKHPGLDLFSEKFKVEKKLLVGPTGIKLKDFFLTPAEEWFNP